MYVPNSTIKICKPVQNHLNFPTFIENPSKGSSKQLPIELRNIFARYNTSTECRLEISFRCAGAFY